MDVIRSCAVALVAAVGVASQASAGTLLFADIASSTEQTGAAFSAALDYQFNGGSNGTLTIDLTNTTPGSVGGYITGLVFNFGTTDPAAVAILESTTQAGFTDAQMVNAAPFGNPFIGGAALGGNWLGGGSPNGGIPIGGSATLTFAINALDAAALTDASFLDGPFDHNFIVRFRGLADGGSDKVPAVPSPGASALAIGALGMIGARRRR